MGKGIGFGRKAGQSIPREDVEKIFRIDNQDSLERFKELLAKLPLAYIQVSNDIITYGKEVLGVQLNENIYLTLRDHISFALDRHKQGMDFQNALLEEIKVFYPKEYIVGKYALHLIEEKTEILLKDDEAASIALHLVNAEYNSKISQTFRMTQLIQDMMNLIIQAIPRLQETSHYRDRLVSNLKYLANRMLSEEPVKGAEDREFYDFVKSHCTEESQIISRLNQLVWEKYQCTMTEEEQIYLAINIKRAKDLYGKG